VLAIQTTTPAGRLAVYSRRQTGLGIGNVNDGGNNFPLIGTLMKFSLYSAL